MKLSCQSIPNATPIEIVSGSATYGIGFITAFAVSLSNLFGKECKMYGKKVEKARAAAVKKMTQQATKLNAAGIMDVRYEANGLSIFVYGMAYAETAAAAAPAAAPAAQPDSWVCQNCGMQNNAAGKFCKGCGQAR